MVTIINKKAVTPKKKYVAGGLNAQPFVDVVDKQGRKFPTREGSGFNPNAPSTEKVVSDVKFNGGTIGNRTVDVNGIRVKQEDYAGGRGNPNTKAGQFVQSQQAKIAEDLINQQKEEEIKKAAEFEFKKTEMIGQMKTDAQRAKFAEELAAINQPIETKPVEGTPFSDTAVRVGTSAGATIGGALAGAGTGAAIGAGIGSIVPVVGTAVGAGVGASIGAVGGGLGVFYAKLGMDKKQDTKEAFNDFNNAKARVDSIITDVNGKAIPPNQAVDYYRNQWANIYQTRDRLRLQTKTAVGRDLSKAQDELADVYAMIDDKFRYDQQLEIAILNPNPKFVPQVSQPTTE